MGIVGFIILGLVAGAIANALHFGPEPGGSIGMLLVGVVGAVIGGLIAAALGVGDIRSLLSVGTCVLAIAGAYVFLVVYDAVVGRDDAGHGQANEL
jgi:uncharacterized membrane protein YeaQ/YmgE (transglycosylase-associated protein family)